MVQSRINLYWLQSINYYIADLSFNFFFTSINLGRILSAREATKLHTVCGKGIYILEKLTPMQLSWSPRPLFQASSFQPFFFPSSSFSKPLGYISLIRNPPKGRRTERQTGILYDGNHRKGGKQSKPYLSSPSTIFLMKFHYNKLSSFLKKIGNLVGLIPGIVSKVYLLHANSVNLSLSHDQSDTIFIWLVNLFHTT